MVMGKARECTKGYQRTGTGSPDVDIIPRHVRQVNSQKG